MGVTGGSISFMFRLMFLFEVVSYESRVAFVSVFCASLSSLVVLQSELSLFYLNTKRAYHDLEKKSFCFVHLTSKKKWNEYIKTHYTKYITFAEPSRLRS
jgi:hypothetical protein